MIGALHRVVAAWTRALKARARTREQRRRAELTACCGSVSTRWLQMNHYDSGKRRGGE
jgi:hypothetical protein